METDRAGGGHAKARAPPRHGDPPPQVAGLQVTTVKDVAPRAITAVGPESAVESDGPRHRSQRKQCRREGQKPSARERAPDREVRCRTKRRPPRRARPRPRAPVGDPAAAAREAEGRALRRAAESSSGATTEGLRPAGRDRREPPAGCSSEAGPWSRAWFAASRRQGRQPRPRPSAVNGRRVDSPPTRSAHDVTSIRHTPSAGDVVALGRPSSPPSCRPGRRWTTTP